MKRRKRPSRKQLAALAKGRAKLARKRGKRSTSTRRAAHAPRRRASQRQMIEALELGMGIRRPKRRKTKGRSASKKRAHAVASKPHKRKATRKQLAALARARQYLAARRRSRASVGQSDVSAWESFSEHAPVSHYYENARKHRDLLRQPHKFGKFSALSALYAQPGKKKTRLKGLRSSFQYATKKGYIRKIPDYALAGYSSAKAFAVGKKKGQKRASKFIARAAQQRAKAANRILRHGGVAYSPNSFKEWSMRKRHHRRYRANPLLNGGYTDQLKEALKVGGVALAGYLIHRIATHVISDNFMKDSKLQRKNLLVAAGVAALGVPLSVKLAPGDAKLVSAGMVASLGHTAAMELAAVLDKDKKEGQTKYAGYLAGYGDRSARAYGSYYEFQPGQVFSGAGEYYRPMSGFGAYQPRFQQAAAGYPQITQAAAGITEAAAGTGEYIAHSVEGIGEYEEVTPEFSVSKRIDDGIQPNVNSAEYELGIAEAAAGVGGFSPVAARETVNPMNYAVPISDEPGGTRAGLFAGQDGIFGTGR